MEEVVDKNIKRREIGKKVLEYSMPLFFVIGLFFLALLVKNVFPFSQKEIGYIDYEEQLVPFYTNFWDILHGKANIFVDFNLGGGGSIITAFFSLYGFLSPFSLLIGIFPRASIIYGIELILLLKFCFMALTSYICFKHFFKNVNKWMLCLFSLVWTFSGWTLVHFTNVGWLDLMILLPLLIMSAKRLLEKNKSVPFVIILTYMLSLSYYLTYMVLVATLIVSVCYVIFLAKDKKQVLSKLFFPIIISILISFAFFIPSCITSLQGHRFSGGSDESLTGLFENTFSKLFVILFYSFPFVFFVRLLGKIKEDKKPVLFFLVSFLVMIVGIFVEPINKMWHTGSYYCYPLRYGFLIIMLVIFGALYYLDKHYKEDEEEKHKKIKDFLLIPLSIPSILGFLFFGVFITLFQSGVHPYRPMTLISFLPCLVVFLCSYILIEMCLRFKNKKLKLGNVCGGVLVFVLVIANLFFGITGFTSVVGNVDNSSRVFNAYNLNLSGLDNSYKIKDRENNYNANFAEITRFPTLQTWIHISSEEQYKAYDQLGLNTNGVILLSGGGTALTDVILGNKYVLSYENLDENYYTKLNTFDYTYPYTNDKNEYTTKDLKINLYEYNLPMQNVYTFNTLPVLQKDNSYAENQNLLYKWFTQKPNDIMEEFSPTITEDDKYFYISCDVEDKNVYLQITNISFYVQVDDVYEREVFSGLNDFGTISNTFFIKINKNSNKNLTLKTLTQNVNIATFDMERFKTDLEGLKIVESSLKIDGDRLKVNIKNVSNDKYALVPFINLKNMSANVNGKIKPPQNIFENFMLVNLQNGENEIEITYAPQYLKLCAIISLVALFVYIIFTILNRKLSLTSKKFVLYSGFILFCVLVFVVGFLVYLKPTFDFFKILIKGIFHI